MVGRGAEPRSSKDSAWGKDKVVHGPWRRRGLAWLEWCDVAVFCSTLASWLTKRRTDGKRDEAIPPQNAAMWVRLRSRFLSRPLNLGSCAAEYRIFGRVVYRSLWTVTLSKGRDDEVEN